MKNTQIKIRNNTLVVMVGAMGTGKSTFCKKWFAPEHVVSSDFIRQQLSGDFRDQSQNTAVFEILFATIEARIKAGLLTVVDSTGSRSVLNKCAELAKKYNFRLIAIELPELHSSELTRDRMKHRFHHLDVYHRQVNRIKNTIYPKHYTVYKIDKDADVSIGVEKVDNHNELDPNFRYVIIPDLHGECSILEKYISTFSDDTKIIFLGDIVDRGESSYKTFKMVKEIVDSGRGFIVKGNHDKKFAHYLKKWVKEPVFEGYEEIPTYGMKLSHGLQMTVSEFYTLPSSEMIQYAKDFIAFYQDAHLFLHLSKNEIEHYFAHANINSHLVRGFMPRKCDESKVIYNKPDMEQLYHTFEHMSDVYVNLHIGHVFEQLSYAIKVNPNNPKHTLIQHDVGFGKNEYSIESLPELYYV